MLALIFDEGKIYPSPIFAIKGRSWDMQVVAFDSDYTCIKRIPVWHPGRKVFFLDSTDFSHQKGAWQGEDWLIGDRALLGRLKRGKRVFVEEHPKFKEYHRVELPEWFEIQDEHDAKSLMDVSMGFHDAVIMKMEHSGNDLEILFDTTWGCYITVRFEDVIQEELIERIRIILDSEMQVQDDGICWTVTRLCTDTGLDLESDPTVKCKRVFWKIRIEDRLSLVYHRNYECLEDLRDDIQRYVPNAEIKDGRIVLTNGTDCMEIEPTHGGYCAYINGEREKGVCEDQDIFSYAVDFGEECSEPEPLWTVTLTKWQHLLSVMKYSILPLSVWIAFWTVLAAMGEMLWRGVLIFGGVGAIVYIIGMIPVWLRQPPTYKIFEQGIAIGYPATVYWADFERIESIRVKRSLFCKRRGTIAFKLRNVVSWHYRFVFVENVDEVYDLLQAHWKRESDCNDQRALKLVQEYGFAFENIQKQEIVQLLEQELESPWPGSAEYLRVLCGYLYCLGDASDVPLLEKAKYSVNMDVGSMIDAEWIDSLKNGGLADKDNNIRAREEIVQEFLQYYRD